MPLLCILGVGADQPVIAGRVEALGTGKMISPDADASQLRDAAAQVLARASYRQAAHELAGALANVNGAATAVHLRGHRSAPQRRHLLRQHRPHPGGPGRAVLLVLETLAPAERAVFVLREVFDVAYDEIAEAVGKSPGRGPPDRAPGAGTRRGAPNARVLSPAQARDALEAFWRAAETGDLQSPLDILTPDVVFLSPRPSGDPAGLRCSTWTPSPSRGGAQPAGRGRRGQGGGARAGDREVPARRRGERGSHLEVDLKPLPDPEIVDVPVQRRSPVNRVLTGCSRGTAASDRLPCAREVTS